MDSRLFADCIAQSFVLDLGDPAMRAWFGDDELQEIESRVLPLPPRDEVLLGSMKRFWHVSALVFKHDIGWADFRRCSRRMSFGRLLRRAIYQKAQHTIGRCIRTVSGLISSFRDCKSYFCIYFKFVSSPCFTVSDSSKVAMNLSAVPTWRIGTLPTSGPP